MRIALFEPEIAGNVGAVLRLCACFGAQVDLIEPLGFVWDDRRVRRSAMDYIDHVVVARHASFPAFVAAVQPRRMVLFTTKAGQSAYDFRYEADDVLLFGKESAGVPEAVSEACGARADTHAPAGALDEPRDLGGTRTRRGPAADRTPAAVAAARSSATIAFPDLTPAHAPGCPHSRITGAKNRSGPADHCRAVSFLAVPG